AALAGGVNELSAREAGECRGAVLGGAAGERGGGIGVQVWARMQAGEAERAEGGAVEVAARPGEHRPHGGAGVAAGVEAVEAALLVGELADQLGERDGAGGGELGGDPQGEWEPGALGGPGGGPDRGGVDAGG